MAYQLRLLDASAIPHQEALYENVFGYPSRGLTQWKYYKNPNGDAVCVGAFHNETLVGAGAMLPEEMEFNQERYVTFKCTDLMISPQHQRKGLASQINGLLFEEMRNRKPPFLYTLCAKKASPSFWRNGWVKVANVEYRFKPKAFLRLSTILRKTSAKHINHVPDLSRYWRVANKISMHRSEEYMNWRSLNPFFKYGVLTTDGNTGTPCFLVYSIGTSRFLNIVDIAFGLDDNRAAGELIQAAEQTALSENCRGVLGMSTSGSTLDALLQKHFYLKNPFNRGPLCSMLDFNFLALNDQFAHLSENKFWNIYSINYDDV